MARIGLKAKIYRYSGESFDTPNEISICRDVNLNLEKGEADLTTRGSGGWEVGLGTMKKASIEFEIIVDEADANYIALRGSFISGTQLKIACLSGPIDENGVEGLVAFMEVMNFGRGEPLQGAQTIKVTLKPAYNATPPDWMIVSV